MGLDKLGILFIIIILPIALVLNTYTNTQVDTLNMQLEYDTKLNSSTYDAVKTYQINSLSEDASNLGDVRIGNINAAINVFFTSLASNLNMSGYSRQFLQEYVPAIVFTMYDGYYIYSKYTNTLDDADYASQAEVDSKNMENGALDETDGNYLYPSYYQDGQQLYGLKPFIHYSCRYKKGSNYDFIVSYTLDNYITIQGIVNGTQVDMSGYLIDPSKYSGISYNSTTKIATVTGELKYRGVTIKNEEPLLTDNLVLEREDGETPETKAYPYHKVNGVKYYWGGSYWFSMLNGIQNNSVYDFDSKEYDDSAYKYYVEAYEFTKRLENLGITSITTDDIVDSYTVSDANGNESDKQIFKDSTFKIFDLERIEEPDSNFNKHRQEVIRYTIEKNLSISIANYNYYNDTPGFEFRMPEFSEEEWDRIQKNMTVISYLQGLPIGTKIYNGVSVVSNNVNKEVVSEQSIYIVDGPNSGNGPGAVSYNYYPVTKKDWSGIFTANDPVGIYNVDLQKRQVEYNKQTYYYYPKLFFDTYSQSRDTVNLNADKLDITKGEYNYNGNIYKYIDEQLTPNTGGDGYKVAQAFYTALGRERKSRYNQRNNYENLLTQLTEEKLELLNFNSQYTKYESNNLSKEEVESLIQVAKNNNTKYKEAGEADKWVVVRRAGGKTYNSTSQCAPAAGNLVEGTETTLNDVWFNYQNSNVNAPVRNYVNADGTYGSANNSTNYPLFNGQTFTTKCYYDTNGRVRAVYILIN
ncbi:MAG: hypothetical protein J5881_04970 [Clostridia bacterium]|nr:hypothetical protein [Clostridia bacterium]